MRGSGFTVKGGGLAAFFEGVRVGMQVENRAETLNPKPKTAP